MLNTPNILSLFRLCLVPVFIIVYFSGLERASLYAAGIYALALFTDFLDGYIARRFNLITNLGKVLDPLGDKMITFSVLACITIDGIIPVWIVFAFACKELMMGVGGIIIHKRAKVEIPPSNPIGKSSTVIFFLVCVLLIIFDIPHTAAVTMICVALLISFSAFISYVWSFKKIMRQRGDV
jgi:Phosphatidylglycerophosphate synthase